MAYVGNVCTMSEIRRDTQSDAFSQEVDFGDQLKAKYKYQSINILPDISNRSCAIEMHVKYIPFPCHRPLSIPLFSKVIVEAAKSLT